MSGPEGLATLESVLTGYRPAAVAVSGGVDSMTLAHIAHRVLGADVHMFHAASPAVPADAEPRIREHADRCGWRLRIITAGEFADERYLANPADRCFFCKTNLYATLSTLTDRQLLSGTNVDDLGDWRPGLRAADQHAVRHPFVEAGMTKGDVRRAASHFGLPDLAELPAAPCLSSRVETGIRIEPAALRIIDAVESMIRATLRPATVRCRMRADGVVVELDHKTLLGLDDRRQQELAHAIRTAHDVGPIRFSAYERGSAFLRGAADD